MKNLVLVIFCLIIDVTCYSNPYRNIGHYKGYVGCYVDDGNRLLKHRISFLHGITLEKCRHHCRGFRYFGLQYRDWCLCGNHLHSPGYPQASELQCNMPCAGENSRMCGGGYRNSIYHV
ncbi:sialate:O-sulfotransferase 2-like [Mytilus edulis]|uniref:sialate:O-sulfotransferase 2-like n=1 Tax=Mytilus edulis TaxID=6550 RepID=UPI0039EE677A